MLLGCSVCNLVTQVAPNGVQSLQVGRKIHCKEHDGKELSLYCDMCEVPICSVCASQSHRGHQHNSWKNAVHMHQEEIKVTMATMNDYIVALSQVLSCQKAVIAESRKKTQLVETDIISTLNLLHSILNVRRDALTSQLHDMTQEKLEGIGSCQNHFNMLLAQLNSCLSFVEEGFAAWNEIELLSLKGSMVKHVNHLQSVCRKSLKFAENDFHVKLVLTPNNMSELCSEFGSVEVSDNFTDKTMEPAVGPTLSLKLSVKHLKSPLFLFMNMKGPCGVAWNQKGEMIVAEGRADQVSVFNSSGDKLHSIGTCGSAAGEFCSPCAVVVDDIGNIIVVDGCNSRIQKFAPDGQFLAMAGNKGSGRLQFCEPDGIAINSANKMIYIVDNNAHRVQVLNQDLSYHSMLGSKGHEGGHLYYPWGVACSSNGDVYVTDSGNCLVKVFSSGGRFLREFGGKGDAKGRLKWPTGICVTKIGTVYVSEYGNHRVSIFTLGGHFLKCFGKKGTSRAEFGSLRGVNVDVNGLIYICDTENNRIAVY